MKNIHILPTDKPSRLQKFTDVDKIDFELASKNEFFNKGINIYITSDEEIKDGDWMIRNNEQPIKVTEDFFWDFKVRYYKIILTTDKDLIKDGVQEIDDEFLEWFVKNPSCEDVEVVDDTLTIKEAFKVPLGTRNHKYKIIIPKEETLEEASERFYPKKTRDFYYVDVELLKQEAFEDCTKLQQGRMYSDEEVNSLFDTLKSNSIDNVVTITNVDLFINSWKKQLKNK